MNKKLNLYILGFAFLSDGIYSFYTHKSLIKTIIYNPNRQEYSLEYSWNMLIIGIGILFITYYFIKSEKEKYTKCPKCKEVFNYKELINGKCKNCKDVDTVDLDEYFEKYPDELKEKEKNVNKKEQ